jgi:3-methylfumaryl-CoA hydratase
MTTGISGDNIAHWQSWCAKPEWREEVLHGPDVLRLAEALAWDADALGWPPLGHLALFLPPPGPRGADGHPTPRRMFASAEYRFHRPLIAGVPAMQMRVLESLTPKSGKTGTLLLGTVRIEIWQEGEKALEEVQTIVWREASPAQPPELPPVPLPVPASPPPTGDALFTPGPVQLFLFSAATANAHRIHYDLAYASGEEGYPGLVVHGPLVAAQLLGLWERRHGPAKHFGFRAQAPLFAGLPVALAAADDGLQALRCDGTVAIVANAG